MGWLEYNLVTSCGGCGGSGKMYRVDPWAERNYFTCLACDGTGEDLCMLTRPWHFDTNGALCPGLPPGFQQDKSSGGAEYVDSSSTDSTEQDASSPNGDMEPPWISRQGQLV